jgi:uncharacterized protein YkwD
MKRKIIAVFILTVAIGTSLFIGIQIGIKGAEERLKSEVLSKPNYTGQQIQDAVNEYRKSLGLRGLVIDSNLCNDLFDRYAQMLSDKALTEGHPGFNDWADIKIKNYGYSLVGEVFSPESTVDNVLEEWKGSPSHNLAITNEKYNKVCTYAGKKGVVVVLGAK